MTGPRFTVRTVCTLILIGICIAAAVGVMMAASAIGGSR